MQHRRRPPSPARRAPRALVRAADQPDPRRGLRWALLGAALLLVLAYAAAARAEIVTKTVDYKDGDTELQGVLTYDDSVTGRQPGVLVLPEWWGLVEYPRQRARQLAALGYVAFAADMYGKGKTTDDPAQAKQWASQLDRQALRRRAEAGLAQLRASDRVDPARIAVIGYCFGGGAAAELAYSGAKLAGVVTFHGNPRPPMVDDVDRIHCPFLICHGGADPFMTQQQIDQLKKGLDEAGIAWTLVTYSGAKHAFTNPKADSYGLKGVGYNPRAERESFAQMLVFFNEIFKR